MPNTTSLRTTPFHDFHTSHDAKLVDYTGWEMPLHYGSIIDEHVQTRTSGGMFDVSHMGQVRIKGKDASGILERATVVDTQSLAPGQAF